MGCYASEALVIINVDMDGVLADLVGTCRQLIHEEYGIPLQQMPGPYDWEFTNWPVVPFPLFKRPGLWLKPEPYPGALATMHMLHDDGHELRVVSHKPTPGSRSDAMHWLNQHGISDIADVIFVRGGKQAFPADVVIDDKPTQEWAQEDAVNLLFDQPWNRTVETLPGVIRAHGWSGVLLSVRIHDH